MRKTVIFINKDSDFADYWKKQLLLQEAFGTNKNDVQEDAPTLQKGLYSADDSDVLKDQKDQVELLEDSDHSFASSEFY